MTMSITARWLLCLFLGTTHLVMLARCYHAAPTAALDSPAVLQVPDKSAGQWLHNARVVQSYQWEVGDGKQLFYLARTFETDPNWHGPGVRLTILDEQGATLYEAYHSEVSSISSAAVLRDETLQLIVEGNDGGNTTSFIQILKYDQGKISELMDKSDNHYDVNAVVRPAFRSGTSPAKEPFEVLLTSGVGLASPAKKTTRIYRYKNGSYKLAGVVSQQDVDDYMGMLITRNARE